MVRVGLATPLSAMDEWDSGSSDDDDDGGLAAPDFTQWAAPPAIDESEA